MAYGNWGAFVRRNGKREKQWEDATPYREQELEPGYHQAFRRPEGFNPHHAVLGKDRVRLCGYKCYPRLYVDGESRDLEPFATEFTEDKVGDETFKNVTEYAGAIDGYEFRASLSENFVDLWLKEPDGTVWTATCGYEYGAGHGD